MNTWTRKALSELARVRRGASPRPIDDPRWFAREGPGWVRISDVTRANGRLRETEQYLSAEGATHSVRVALGDVLMSICATIGEPVIVEMDACIHDGFVVFDQFEGKLDRKFLLHELRAIAPLLKAKGQTGTQANLNTGIVGTYRVLIPEDPAEQSRIAAVLDTVDEAIAKTEAVIAKLKQVRAGLLHDLLTRGLDEHGQLRDPNAHPEQFKDSPLGRIPREWDILPLERVAWVDRGKFTHRPRNDPAFYGGDFPFIQTGDVALASGESITEASQWLNERGVSVSKEFPAGTIAVTIAANIGDTTILGRPMYFPDSVVGVIAQAPHSTRWIELSLRRAKGRLNALAPQSAQKNINLEFLRPLLIPVPQPLEQNECSKAYEAVNNQVRAESKALEKFVKLKSGIMADLLTGRVRVPEVGLEEMATS